MMILIIKIIFLLLYLLLVIFFAYTIYAFFKAAPFVPTSRKNVKKMIELANLKKTDILCDLGSGDGRIIFFAAKSGARCVGVEINPILYYISKLKSKIKRVKNVEIVRKDLWKIDLSEFDVLTLFFIAPKMDKLMKKIKKEMKSGNRIVSYGFQFPNWQYTKKDGKVYLYEI